MTNPSNPSTLLEAADKTLTTLNYAAELQRLAANVGFDWPNIDCVVDKIKEELEEVLAELNTPNNHERLNDEVGDLLFACINLSRRLNINPEQALKAGSQKFYHRFSEIERCVAKENKTLNDLTLAQLEHRWKQVKKQS